MNPDAVGSLGNGISTTTYTYYANGNLMQAGGWNYMWDYLNRMLASGYNNSTTTYAYDPSGARVLQTSTTSTTYYPSKYFSLTSTKVGSNTYATSTSYIWNGDTLLATIDQKLYNGAATGSPITRYIHPDHLGSTNVVTDASGTVAQLLDYYPYGATRVSSNTYPTNEKRQYIGQYSDSGTGLDYLNARYYDGSRGQFVSQDPVFWSGQNLTDPQSLNSYSYANDNPIVKKDPSGRCLEDGCVVESLAIIGGVMGAAGRYTGDIFENRAEGKTGAEAYVPRSSPAQYAAAVGTGAAASVATAYSMGLAAILGAGGFALDNKMAGKPFNLKNTLTVGLLSYLGGSFFEWGAGDVPMSLLMKKNIVGGVFDMSSQAILQNMLLTNSALNISSGQTTAATMPSAIYQNGIVYYRNSSGLLTTTPPAQSTPSASSGGSGG